MEDNKLIQEIKRHAVIVALRAIHSDLEISGCLKVARSFVHKVRQELEASGDDVETRNTKHVQTVLEHHSFRTLLPYRKTVMFLRAQSEILSTKTFGTSPT
ncbi:unnamed protein product [Arctia plantaginis]|uniref:Uncharacterized protein n=1 Tax=Arctia plantaginis TaxID=874455 RepID=A0A8S0ZG03_ARCPL|nr:unnamed protein product [Arctia plantaginis]